MRIGTVVVALVAAVDVTARDGASQEFLPPLFGPPIGADGPAGMNAVAAPVHRVDRPQALNLAVPRRARIRPIRHANAAKSRAEGLALRSRNRDRIRGKTDALRLTYDPDVAAVRHWAAARRSLAVGNTKSAIAYARLIGRAAPTSAVAAEAELLLLRFDPVYIPLER